MGFLLSSAIKHKIAASVIIGALSLGTAISTFASQDMLPGQSQDEVTVSQTAEETVVPTATPEGEVEATATPTPESEPTATATSEATPTATPEASEATPTPTPESEPEATATPEDDETGPRDVVGIPDDNPVKQPEDGDGVCEKGETVIKTTPSGNLVNVPCRAVKTPEPSDEEEPEDDE